MNELSQNQRQFRKTYQKYTLQMRLKLIKLVDQEKLSTAQAGRIVGIKQTSACRIINSYKKYGRIFEKKADKLLRQNKSRPEMPQKKEEIKLKEPLSERYSEQMSQKKQKISEIKKIKKEEMSTIPYQHSFESHHPMMGYSIPLPFHLGIPPQYQQFQNQWIYPYPHFF